MQNEFQTNLRVPNKQDFYLMLEIELNPENSKYTSLEKPGIDEIWAFLVSEHNLESNAQIRFVIELYSQGIGFIDIYNADFALREAFVGVILIEKYRGKGMASQALCQLKSYAIEQGIIRLCAEVSDENEPSLKFFKRNGFRIQTRKDNFTILTLALQ